MSPGISLQLGISAEIRWLPFFPACPFNTIEPSLIVTAITSPWAFLESTLTFVTVWAHLATSLVAPGNDVSSSLFTTRKLGFLWKALTCKMFSVKCVFLHALHTPLACLYTLDASTLRAYPISLRHSPSTSHFFSSGLMSNFLGTTNYQMLTNFITKVPLPSLSFRFILQKCSCLYHSCVTG